MYEIVMAVLLEKGIPATFFINSDFVDNKKLCYQHKASIIAERIKEPMSAKVEREIRETLLKNNIPYDDIKSGVLNIRYHQKEIIDRIAELVDLDFGEYLLKKRPYLTSIEIEHLIKNGFTIGAHSIDHPLYSALSVEEQLFQTEMSVKYVREKFSLGYGAFAFPHGDDKVSGRYFVELFDSGLVDVSFGTRGIIDDEIPWNIQRISFEKPLMPAKRILALHCAKRMYKIIKGESGIKREC
jgi:peptidoglycan/xylan/chitin deacetylase (PgdA/CDA1 family)